MIYRERLNYSMFITATLYFFPSSLQAVCYSTYIGLGQTLNLSIAYVLLNVFDILRDPIKDLPLFIGQVIEFGTSMRRIQEFLEVQEINQSVVAVAQERQENALAIQIKPHSYFYWSLKEQGGGILGNNQTVTPVKKQEKADNDDRFKKDAGDVGEQSSPSKNSERDYRLSDIICLKDIELNVKQGEFVCIIGDVGAGKSSLLNCLIGDLRYLDQEFVEQNASHFLDDPNIRESLFEQERKQHSTAPIQINQSVSYAQQLPWIQNKTIRENILFGAEFDEQRYWNTINICQLSRDLDILPAGDMTEIGERGINLSGGQKARVSLARAVYAERGIVLLDDPLAALDANVKKNIFENVLLKHLQKKTRVMVTHAVDFLKFVDRVVVMKQGAIVLEGPFEDIKDDPYLQQLMSIYKTHKIEKGEDKEKDQENFGTNI